MERQFSSGISLAVVYMKEKNYAVPYRSSVLYMLYNKQVFADNNLDVPTTWDEFY